MVHYQINAPTNKADENLKEKGVTHLISLKKDL